MTKQYQRILLKLSGEAFADKNNIIAADALTQVVDVIKAVVNKKIELAIVVGAGNIIRGRSSVKNGVDNITGDNMGMLATIINALALNDFCKNNNIKSVVMSAVATGNICSTININKAKFLLKNNTVVIFAAGTGNPCFTTDSAAALRAIEIEADIVFKATNVDGVYSADPKQDKNAMKYKTLSFDDAIAKKLKIMDVSAFSLCREHNIDICVFNMLSDDKDILLKIINGEILGTIIHK